MVAGEKRRADGLDIASMGKPYTGAWAKKYWSCSRGKDRYPYPVGYQAVRYITGHMYSMEIREGPKGPLFVVNCEEGITCSAETPTIAWENILKKRHAGVKKAQGRNPSERIDGLELFGFINPVVQRLLRELIATQSGQAEQSNSIQSVKIARVKKYQKKQIVIMQKEQDFSVRNSGEKRRPMLKEKNALMELDKNISVNELEPYNFRLEKEAAGVEVLEPTGENANVNSSANSRSTLYWGLKRKRPVRVFRSLGSEAMNGPQELNAYKRRSCLKRSALNDGYKNLSKGVSSFQNEAQIKDLDAGGSSVPIANCEMHVENSAMVSLFLKAESVVSVSHQSSSEACVEQSVKRKRLKLERMRNKIIEFHNEQIKSPCVRMDKSFSECKIEYISSDEKLDPVNQAIVVQRLEQAGGSCLMGDCTNPTIHVGSEIETDFHNRPDASIEETSAATKSSNLSAYDSLCGTGTVKKLGPQEEPDLDDTVKISAKEKAVINASGDMLLKEVATEAASHGVLPDSLDAHSPSLFEAADRYAVIPDSLEARSLSLVEAEDERNHILPLKVEPVFDQTVKENQFQSGHDLAEVIMTLGQGKSDVRFTSSKFKPMPTVETSLEAENRIEVVPIANMSMHSMGAVVPDSLENDVGFGEHDKGVPLSIDDDKKMANSAPASLPCSLGVENHIVPDSFEGDELLLQEGIRTQSSNDGGHNESTSAAEDGDIVLAEVGKKEISEGAVIPDSCENEEIEPEYYGRNHDGDDDNALKQKSFEIAGFHHDSSSQSLGASASQQSSDKLESDSMGQELSKSMITLLLPKAIPFLRRKHKVGRNSANKSIESTSSYLPPNDKKGFTGVRSCTAATPSEHLLKAMPFLRRKCKRVKSPESDSCLFPNNTEIEVLREISDKLSNEILACDVHYPENLNIEAHDQTGKATSCQFQGRPFQNHPSMLFSSRNLPSGSNEDKQDNENTGEPTNQLEWSAECVRVPVLDLPCSDRLIEQNCRQLPSSSVSSATHHESNLHCGHPVSPPKNNAHLDKQKSGPPSVLDQQINDLTADDKGFPSLTSFAADSLLNSLKIEHRTYANNALFDKQISDPPSVSAHQINDLTSDDKGFPSSTSFSVDSLANSSLNIDHRTYVKDSSEAQFCSDSWKRSYFFDTGLRGVCHQKVKDDGSIGLDAIAKEVNVSKESFSALANSSLNVGKEEATEHKFPSETAVKKDACFAQVELPDDYNQAQLLHFMNESSNDANPPMNSRQTENKINPLSGESHHYQEAHDYEPAGCYDYKPVGCFDHPIPVLTMHMNVHEEKLQLCACCKTPGENTVMLFIYEAVIKANIDFEPCLLACLRIHPSDFVMDIELALQNGLQFTPDGKKLILAGHFGIDCERQLEIGMEPNGLINKKSNNGVKVISFSENSIFVQARMNCNMQVHCLLLLKPNMIVGAGEGGCVICWTMDPEWRIIKASFTLTHPGCNSNYLPDIMQLLTVQSAKQLVVSCDESGSFFLWDIEKRLLLSSFKISISTFCPVRMIDLASITQHDHGQLTCQQSCFEIPILCFLIQDEKKVYAEKGKINNSSIWGLYFVSNGSVVAHFNLNDLHQTALAITPMNHLGAMGTAEGLVFLWDLLSGSVITILNELEGLPVNCISTTHNSMVLAVSREDGRIMVYWKKN